MAESHELRNARLAEALKSWVADDGDAIDRPIETIWLCAVARFHVGSLYSIANLRKERKQTVDIYPFLSPEKKFRELNSLLRIFISLHEWVNS